MLQIKEKQLHKFHEIKKLFLSKTVIPKENNWLLRTSNDIWLEIVAQVVVVGRSDPLNRLNKKPNLKDKIAYENLLKIEDQHELERRINRVLLAIGTRYASSQISKCRKTEAIAHNLQVLKGFEGGPKEFLAKLSRFNDDKRKIKSVMNTFKYIKNKGARDLLMELGLVRNAIALDARIQNVLQKIGIETSKGFQSDPKLYDKMENDILTKICKPLGILGVELDRMLYQNYEEIMKMKL